MAAQGQGPPFDQPPGTPASMPSMPAGPQMGQQFFPRNRAPAGGGGNQPANHTNRRRRGRGNPSAQQPTVPKYGQPSATAGPVPTSTTTNTTSTNTATNAAHTYVDGDSDFPPKLPSDTAPAYRFVEKRTRRGRNGGHHRNPPQPAASTLSPSDLPQGLPPKPPPGIHTGPRPAFLQDHNPHHANRRQENIVPARPIRILQPPHRASRLPEASHVPAPNPGTPPVGGGPTAVVEHGKAEEAKVASPVVEEAGFPEKKPHMIEEQPAPIVKTEQQKPDHGVRKFAGLALPLTGGQQTAPARELTMEEAIEKISIRELLDNSDVIEPLPRHNHTFVKLNIPAPSTPASRLPDLTAFSSPLTLTQTPSNLNGNSAAAQTPVERFLKIADLTSRYLTERLDEISYNPDLSRRLKADFEVFDAAYNALPFDNSLNPYRVIHNSLTSLKRCLEQRNHDARVLGALKHMTQTYDMIRTQAIHERWLKGEPPVDTVAMRERFQLGCIAIAKSGENLVDTLKWNIRGGDMHVRLFQNHET
ncbi:hypothetical protein ABW21_db0205073 [Orbilia brochopaga]|nr:hypothetical protein ABW21_db0205073 [Drechslerella brochopaga]